MAPVLSLDEKTLYVCNRFDQDVSIIDLESGNSCGRIPVQREPIAATLTPDGQQLLVVSHLQSDRANRASAAATLNIVDLTTEGVVEEIALRGGSGLVRGIAVSPDGAYAAVTHILAHFHWVPRMAYLGWINQNVVSLIDLQSRQLLATVALDEDGRGAANPWAVAWSADGQSLCVAHAGTHELSVLNAPALLDKLSQLPERRGDCKPGRRRDWEYYRFPEYGPARSRFDLPSDFSFLQGMRKRIPLTGVGPRCLAVVGNKAYVAHYFTDSVDIVDLDGTESAVRSIALLAEGVTSPQRAGERWFNDATLCVQGWQSCASCHDADGRADGFNWDLLNDGPHNPKNTRSLLLAPATPPVMALGVRDSAQTAVRAGLHHILFGDHPPEVAIAIDQFLESLRLVPSPRLEEGMLSAAAERGRRIFHRTDVGCARCHPAPLFTNLRAYDVGTTGDYDKSYDCFDTPSLIESWRTAPYLHDGSAATLHDVLTARNAEDRHGRTSQLSAGEIDDLAEYVLSL
jgi:DNA-binding beta-propeller fold protein YncE